MSGELTRREALRAGAAGVLALAGAGLNGCSSTDAGQRVVAYCSVDADVARPLFDKFTKLSDVQVDAVFDTEATKTTGLVNRILGEKSRPGADVWWSSEPFGAIRLARAGVLDRFECAHEKDFARGWPKSLRASDGTWYGCARRQRVLVYNTKNVPGAEAPKSPGELASTRWMGRIGLARPQFGSTRGQMAALLMAHGEAEFSRWLSALKANRVRLYDGNAGVVRAAAHGEIFVGLTDNDDVASGKENAWGVEMIAASSELAEHASAGTSSTGEAFPARAMQVPCTVALVKNGPNRAGGARLANFLLSRECDDAMTASVFQTFPVREPARSAAGLRPRDVHGREWLELSNLDLERVADHDSKALELCERILG